MRYSFAADFAREVRIRGLSLTEVARLAGVSLATVSGAVHGKSINLATAVRIARAVGGREVIPELDAWSDHL